MFVVALCSFIAFLLTVFESRGGLKGGMKLGFILVTILGVIHYDYGNDYMSYYNMYKSLTSNAFDFTKIVSGNSYKEPGWELLCWFFKPVGGFFMMVAVLNIIQNCIVYSFIKRYVHFDWWPLSIFIYLFATNFYLMSFSMMRQEFVVIVFLGLWSYIKEKKYIIPLLVLYFCSFIHSSSIILLPFAFWGYIPIKNGKILCIIYVSLLFVLWLFQDTLNSIFQFTLTLDEDFSEYAKTYDDGDFGMKIGIGFFLNMIPFVLSIIYMQSNKIDSLEKKQIVALGALVSIITPFGQIIPTIGRLGMYFSVYNIGAVPIIYSFIKNILWRRILILVYCLMILYDYISFFQNDIWVEHYSEFHTIIPQIF